MKASSIEALRLREFGGYLPMFPPYRPLMQMTACYPPPKLHGVAAVALASAFARQPESVSYAGIDLAGLEKVALIDFRRGMPGLIASTPIALIQIFPEFSEVLRPALISAENLAQRLSFARETGFMLVGAGEALALILQSTQESESESLVVAIQNCSEGLPLELATVTARNLHEVATERRISALSHEAASIELEKARTEWAHFKHRPNDFGSSRGERIDKTRRLLWAHHRMVSLRESARTASAADMPFASAQAVPMSACEMEVEPLSVALL